MSISAVKITARQEQMAVDMIATKKFEQIHVVLAPDSLTSYVMVEANDDGIVTRVLEEIPHVRGLVGGGGVVGTSGTAEVEHLLSPTPDVEGIAESDTVELIAGPLKGEKARVQRIGETKDQVTVELYEVTVPILVTAHGDQIRVLDFEER